MKISGLLSSIDSCSVDDGLCPGHYFRLTIRFCSRHSSKAIAASKDKVVESVEIVLVNNIG